MSVSPEREFASNDEGVSEVLSFILSILVSFLLVGASLYVFNELNAENRREAARAQLQDVANRVVLAVEEAAQVASARCCSSEIATSTYLRFVRVIEVPQDLQGWAYTISLDANYVNGTVGPANLEENAPTLNLASALAPPGGCTGSYPICTVSGSTLGSHGKITITYLYDAAGGPTNSLTIS